MMVVHEDNERPVEVAVIRKPLLEQKSYVIVKNHVRELTNTESTSNIRTSDVSPQSSSNANSKRKKRKSAKKQDDMPTTLIESNIVTSTSTKIDTNDLEELRSVYMKCKEVMNRIETKYGHLLDLDSEAGHCSKRKRNAYSETSEDECECKLKKKIVFDDDGRQVTVDTIRKNHTCAKKMKHASSEIQTRSRTIAVEYNDVEITLPDDLNELRQMLQSHNIEKTYRNKILEKIRSIKQEYVNDLRFNRHILIEKLKSNPDDVLDFKGTNLSTIPGYS